MRYLIVVEKSETGFSAYSPVLPRLGRYWKDPSGNGTEHARGNRVSH